MQVDLDIWEMGWLLDSALRGSHLRASTITRFVNEWYDLLTEQQRYNLYEWSLRLTYNGAFKPSDTSCGADIVFMKRYDPENQYKVTTKYNGETQVIRAFLYDDHYHLNKERFIAPEYIVKVEKFVPNVKRTEYELKATKRN